MAATLLAAGRGRRLGGRPKAALRIEGLSLLERLVQALRGAGVDEIGVVLGPYADRLKPLARRAGAEPIEHTLDAPTRVDSQRLALQHHLAHRRGRDLMLLVADLPGLASAHVEALLQIWADRPADQQALVPRVDGQRGHPVILSWDAVRAIAAQPPAQGVRDWMQASPACVGFTDDADGACIRDLDTPEDLEALRLAFAPGAVTWPPDLPRPELTKPAPAAPADR